MSIAFLTFLFLVSHAMPDSHANESSIDSTQIGGAVLVGMHDARQRLRSGIVYVEETRKEADLDGTVHESRGSYYCAFDFDRDLFRFDRQPEVVQVFGSAPNELHRPGNATLTAGTAPQQGKFVRTPECTFHWMGGVPIIQRLGPEAPPLDVARYFDPRCLGLISTADLELNLDYEKLYGSLTTQRVIDADDAAGLIRLTWRFGPEGVVRRTAWFDPQRGFSPVRVEFHDDRIETSPVQMAETGWDDVSGIWVPSTMLLSRRFGPTLDLSWTLHWESVNELIDSKLFTAEGLELPGRIAITSRELGEPVRLGYEENGRWEAWAPPFFQNRSVRAVAIVTSILLGALMLFLVIMWRARWAPHR